MKYDEKIAGIARQKLKEGLAISDQEMMELFKWLITELGLDG